MCGFSDVGLYVTFDKTLWVRFTLPSLWHERFADQSPKARPIFLGDIYDHRQTKQILTMLNI